MGKGALLVLTMSGVGKTTLTDIARPDDINVIDFNYRPWMFLKDRNIKKAFLCFYRKLMSSNNTIILKNVVDNSLYDFIIEPKRTIIVLPDLDSKDFIINGLIKRNAPEKKVQGVIEGFEHRRELLLKIAKENNIETISLPKGKHLSDLYEVLIQKLNNK